MYGSPRLGIFLFICHFLACITVGFLFRFYKAGRNNCHGKNSNRKYSTDLENSLTSFRKRLLDDYNKSESHIGIILGDAVRNSISTILAIGGFIVLFSVIIHLLTDTGIIGAIANTLSYILSPLGIDNTIIKGILSGLFEITTGSGLVSATAGIPIFQQLPAASFIIGWAGLSVHFQVMSIAAKTDISIRPYLLGKLLQGVISALYTWLGLKLFSLELLLGEPVLSNISPFPTNWLYTLETATLMLSAILVAFAVFTVAGRFKASFSK